MIVFAAHTLLIRRGSTKYCILLLCAHLKISCISRICRVWNNVCVCMCVKQQTYDLYIIICNCIYSVVINCGLNNNVSVKIVAWWNQNVFTSSWLDRQGEIVFTIHIDVIHFIVTVLSDHPSFEWECNITGRQIWLRPLKWTFLTCFHVVAAQHGMDAMLSEGLAKWRWAVLGMVTEGDDWVVRTSHFYGSYKGSWKAQLLYAGCVHFTVIDCFETYM